MYLGPHHFQAQSRFFEDSVHFLADCLSQYHYGYINLEIDQTELPGGSFLVHHAAGAMPDGLIFDLPEEDESQLSRSIAGIFPQTGRPLTLYLAIPSYREDRPNLANGEQGGVHSSARFRSTAVAVNDFNTGKDAKQIKLLSPNLRIATEREITADDVSLPLARILRDGKGQYVLDPQFVPPCLQVAASPRLEQLLERLLEILSEKSRNLTLRRRSASTSEIRGDTRELVEFWLLHAINSALPALRSWRHGSKPHPAQIYLNLAQLAGALCTFGTESEATDLPVYDHLALGDCFSAIDERIRRHLELCFPTNCLTIPLDKLNNLFLQGTISDPRCFGKSSWVLAIRADVPETRLISEAPSLVKISAKDWIERVVRSSVPGAPLIHMSVPPASVPVQFGTVYFAIDQNHRLFDPIRDHKDIGIYVPGELANPEVKLYVVIGETLP